MKLGNINSIINNTFIENCKELANKYKSYGRSLDEILKHTISGEAIEILVCEVLKLEKTEFEISQYDATKDGKKYEIKHTTLLSDWWTFKYESYSHFLNNSHNIDYIILVYLNKENNDVFLKYIANAKTFKNYIKKSMYNERYIYNVKKAKENNEINIF